VTARALLESPLIARRERLWPVVVASLAVHAAVLAVATLHRPAPRMDLDQKPIVAKLVRLGEKKPPHLLPRKEEAAPPPPAQQAPPAPAPIAKPEPAPAKVPAVQAKPVPPAPKVSSPKSAASSSRSDVLASVLSKVKRDKALSEPVYGDPLGDPGGDAEDASAGDRYLALVERSLRESYVLPSTISERDRMHLKATVILFLSADGGVVNFSFEQKSGNGAFDAALERAIRAARIPPPPPELRQKYRSEGLGVVYRP
jgi:colicin import membrane protein/protein TonB